jgi:hypothetical protein
MTRKELERRVVRLQKQLRKVRKERRLAAEAATYWQAMYFDYRRGPFNSLVKLLESK